MENNKTILFINSKIQDIDIFINGINNDVDYYIVESSYNFEYYNNILNDYNDIEYIGFVYHYYGYSDIPFCNIDKYDDYLLYNGLIFESFIKLIEKLKEINNNIIIDLLTCNLKNKYFTDQLELIENKYNITIRYSNTNIGYLNGWILESHDVDIKYLYFTDTIDEWKYILTTQITGNSILNIEDGEGPVFEKDGSTYKLLRDIEWSSSLVGVNANTDFIELTDNEIFDGQYYKITIDFIDYEGLFSINTTGKTVRPIIKNIHIDWLNNSLNNGGGGIVKKSQDYFEVHDSYTNGVIDDVSAGGISGSGTAGVGVGGDVLIKNCYSLGDINGNSAGGICGNIPAFNNGSTSNDIFVYVENCYSRGNINGNEAGGIIGRRGAHGSGQCEVIIRKCFTTGNINGFDTNIGSGGITGDDPGYNGGIVRIEDCFTLGDIPINNDQSGFICGTRAGVFSSGTSGVYIERCYSIEPANTNNRLYGKNPTLVRVNDCVQNGGDFTGATNNGSSTLLTNIENQIYTPWDSLIWKIDNNSNFIYPTLILYQTDPWKDFINLDSNNFITPPLKNFVKINDKEDKLVFASNNGVNLGEYWIGKEFPDSTYLECYLSIPDNISLNDKFVIFKTGGIGTGSACLIHDGNLILTNGNNNITTESKASILIENINNFTGNIGPLGLLFERITTNTWKTSIYWKKNLLVSSNEVNIKTERIGGPIDGGYLNTFGDSLVYSYNNDLNSFTAFPNSENQGSLKLWNNSNIQQPTKFDFNINNKFDNITNELILKKITNNYEDIPFNFNLEWNKIIFEGTKNGGIEATIIKDNNVKFNVNYNSVSGTDNNWKDLKYLGILGDSRFRIDDLKLEKKFDTDSLIHLNVTEGNKIINSIKTLYYNGINSISIMKNNFVNSKLENWSLCFWFNPDDVVNEQVLLSLRGRINFYLFIGKTVNKIGFTINDIVYDNYGFIDVNNWYFIVIIKNNNNFKLYLNSTIIADETVSVNNISDTSTIGGLMIFNNNNYDITNYYEGDISIINYYNKILKIDEIKILQNYNFLFENNETINKTVGIYSLKQLVYSYEGACVRIRRGIDNKQTDFFRFNNDKYLKNLNGRSVDNWLNGSNGYIVKLYDQSNKQNNFIINDIDKEPLLIKDSDGEYGIIPNNYETGLQSENTETRDISGITGGDNVYEITDNGEIYVVHEFKLSGTFDLTNMNINNVDVEYLVVGGGGKGHNTSGGTTDDGLPTYRNPSGGGGGGGFVEGVLLGVEKDTYNITIGNSDQDSKINNGVEDVVIGIAGGDGDGQNGGSGGGGRGKVTNGAKKTGGSGTQPSSQWNGNGKDGADGVEEGGAHEFYGGGGGGAGFSSSTINGGDGLISSITGQNVHYSGGGGGGKKRGFGNVSLGGSGGLGGGGDGGGSGTNTGDRDGQNGQANTGGGGGGAGFQFQNQRTGTGGTGGSGIVILRYKKSNDVPLNIMKNMNGVSYLSTMKLPSLIGQTGKPLKITVSNNSNDALNNGVINFTEGDSIIDTNSQKIHIFNIVGTYSINVPEIINDAEILVVAGGGAGGNGIEFSGGGGGGGGEVIHQKNIKLEAGSINIKIGKGGNAGSAENGDDSYLGTIVAKGGGGGGSRETPNEPIGKDGGSGGGGSRNNAGGSSIANVGFGNDGSESNSSGQRGGAGGGGAVEEGSRTRRLTSETSGGGDGGQGYITNIANINNENILNNLYRTIQELFDLESDEGNDTIRKNLEIIDEMGIDNYKNNYNDTVDRKLMVVNLYETYGIITDKNIEKGEVYGSGGGGGRRYQSDGRGGQNAGNGGYTNLDALDGFGGGGGGGSGEGGGVASRPGGKGGSGIIVIKYNKYKISESLGFNQQLNTELNYIQNKKHVYSIKGGLSNNIVNELFLTNLNDFDIVELISGMNTPTITTGKLILNMGSAGESLILHKNFNNSDFIIESIFKINQEILSKFGFVSNYTLNNAKHSYLRISIIVPLNDTVQNNGSHHMLIEEYVDDIKISEFKSSNFNFSYNTEYFCRIQKIKKYLLIDIFNNTNNNIICSQYFKLYSNSVYDVKGRSGIYVNGETNAEIEYSYFKVKGIDNPTSLETINFIDKEKWIKFVNSALFNIDTTNDNITVFGNVHTKIGQILYNNFIMKQSEILLQLKNLSSNTNKVISIRLHSKNINDGIIVNIANNSLTVDQYIDNVINNMAMSMHSVNIDNTFNIRIKTYNNKLFIKIWDHLAIWNSNTTLTNNEPPEWMIETELDFNKGFFGFDVKNENFNYICYNLLTLSLINMHNFKEVINSEIYFDNKFITKKLYNKLSNDSNQIIVSGSNSVNSQDRYIIYDQIFFDQNIDDSIFFDINRKLNM